MPTQITEAQAEELAHETAELQKAYQIAFSGSAGQLVRDDLDRFTRMNMPCWSEDQRHHARLEGRREVGLRIRDQVTLPLEVLIQRLVGDNYVVVKIEDPENGD